MPRSVLLQSVRATAQTETSDNLSILTMLQQQQAVLQRVLDGQKSLEECQNKMEQSLAELQKNMEQSAQCSTADSGILIIKGTVWLHAPYQ